MQRSRQLSQGLHVTQPIFETNKWFIILVIVLKPKRQWRLPSMDGNLNYIWWQIKAFSHKNNGLEEMKKTMVKEC